MHVQYERGHVGAMEGRVLIDFQDRLVLCCSREVLDWCLAACSCSAVYSQGCVAASSVRVACTALTCIALPELLMYGAWN